MTENLEIWKSLKGIVDYGDYYEVSNMGRVRSVDRYVNSRNGKRLVKGQILKPQEDKDGYHKVDFYIKRRSKKYSAHRLVCIAFKENTDNKEFVNHKDGNKQNNHIDNLEWATASENTRHAFDNNLINVIKGEEKYNAKLSDNDVIEIYKLYKTNKLSINELSEMFDISASTVYKIVKREIWTHIDLGNPIDRDMSESLISSNKDIVNNIIEMFKNGLTLRKISKETNISRTVVKSILEDNSIEVKPNYIKLSEEKKSEIIELYNTNLYTKTKLAEMFGVSRPTIRKIISDSEKS